MGKVLAAIGSTLAVIALAWLYGNARASSARLDERLKWEKIVADASMKAEKGKSADIMAQRNALQGYADRYAGWQPVILRSNNTVVRYAETPAGRIQCLPADRVLRIEADAAALGLESTAATGGRDDEVPEDASDH